MSWGSGGHIVYNELKLTRLNIYKILNLLNMLFTGTRNLPKEAQIKSRTWHVFIFNRQHAAVCDHHLSRRLNLEN